MTNASRMVALSRRLSRGLSPRLARRLPFRRSRGRRLPVTNVFGVVAPCHSGRHAGCPAGCLPGWLSPRLHHPKGPTRAVTQAVTRPVTRAVPKLARELSPRLSRGWWRPMTNVLRMVAPCHQAETRAVTQAASRMAAASDECVGDSGSLSPRLSRGLSRRLPRGWRLPVTHV